MSKQIIKYRKPHNQIAALNWQGWRCYLNGCRMTMKPPGLQRQSADRPQCEATLDHVVPVHEGGQLKNNVAFACRDCNENLKQGRPARACEILYAKLLRECVWPRGCQNTGSVPVPLGVIA